MILTDHIKSKISKESLYYLVQSSQINAFQFNQFYHFKPLEIIIYQIKNGLKDGPALIYHHDWSLSATIDYQNHIINGLIKRYYSNQKTSLQLEVFNNSLTGSERTYYPNGKIRTLINFWKNIVDGQIESYYQTGQKQFELLVQKGKKEGFERTYWMTGDLKSQKLYQRGLQCGQEIHWYNQDQPSLISYWKDGFKEGLYQEWYCHGQIKILTNYHQDQLEGLYQEWWENGQRAKRCSYHNNQLNGQLTLYDQEGYILVSEQYRDDLRDGISYQLFRGLNSNPLLSGLEIEDDSIVELCQDYRKGQLHGVTKVKVNTLVRRTVLYLDGLKNGGQIDYDSNGQKGKMIYYVRGESKLILE